MTVAYAVIYLIMKYMGKTEEHGQSDRFNHTGYQARFSHEFSEELTQNDKIKENTKNKGEVTSSCPCNKNENNK